MFKAVDVIDQRGITKQVDVDINICFCNNQNCNEMISGSDKLSVVFNVIIMALIAKYLM